ncbi:exported hypothetical protein [metagenome]
MKILSYDKTSGRIIFLIAFAFLAFGVFNVLTNSYAQASEENSPSDDVSPSNVVNLIILQLISQTGPIVAAITTIGIQFLRNHGIKISQEAEHAFVETASMLVVRQSKWIYEELRDNPQYVNQLGQGQIPSKLGEQAKANVIANLEKELDKPEFKNAAVDTLKENIPELVESMVAKTKLLNSERSRKLIEELTPAAVDAVLLKFESKDEMKKNVDVIVAEATKSIKDYFHFEEVLYHGNLIDIKVKSELSKKIHDLSIS